MKMNFSKDELAMVCLLYTSFLNHRNRITYNDLCRSCTYDCKQSFRAVIILCPRYYSCLLYTSRCV